MMKSMMINIDDILNKENYLEEKWNDKDNQQNDGLTINERKN